MKVVTTSSNQTNLSEASKLRYEIQIYLIKLSRKLFFQFWFAHYALIFHFRSTTRASKEAFFHAIFETCLILSVRSKLSPPGHFKGPRIRKYPRGSALLIATILASSVNIRKCTLNKLNDVEWVTQWWDKPILEIMEVSTYLSSI